VFTGPHVLSVTVKNGIPREKLWVRVGVGVVMFTVSSVQLTLMHLLHSQPTGEAGLRSGLGQMCLL
jgi:hypothetical protein